MIKYGVLSLMSRMHPMLLHLGDWSLDPRFIAFGYDDIKEAEKVREAILNKDQSINPQNIQVISYKLGD